MDKIQFNQLKDGGYEAEFVSERGYGTERHEGSVINVEKPLLDLGVQYGILKDNIKIKNRNGNLNHFYIIDNRMSLLHVKEDMAIMTDTYIDGQCVGEVLQRNKKTVSLKVSKRDGRVIPNISMKDITHQNNAGVYVFDKNYNIPFKTAMELLLEGKTGGIIFDKINHHIEGNWNNMFNCVNVLSQLEHNIEHKKIGQGRHDLSVVIKELGQLQAFIDYMNK